MLFSNALDRGCVRGLCRILLTEVVSEVCVTTIVYVNCKVECSCRILLSNPLNQGYVKASFRIILTEVYALLFFLLDTVFLRLEVLRFVFLPPPFEGFSLSSFSLLSDVLYFFNISF